MFGTLATANHKLLTSLLFRRQSRMRFLVPVSLMMKTMMGRRAARMSLAQKKRSRSSRRCRYRCGKFAVHSCPFMLLPILFGCG